jgi:CRP-like cAMP-binding protein
MPTPSPAALAGVNLFDGLDDATLEAVIAASRRVRAPAGGFFFHQGAPATAFYVLVSGRVRLSQVTPEGNNVVMHFFGPGEAFAIIAALGHLAYPASAEVLEDAEAMAWDGEAFSALSARFAPLSANVMKLMAQRMREFQDRMRELSTERVERRIARALLRLAGQSGRKTDAGILVDLPLSRQDLAEMSGTTLYTVSRTLSDWEARGIVTAGRKRVVIRDPHGLVAVAEELGGSGGR